MTTKSQRMRGRRTHGYGSQKKHRGSGSLGGAGMAGVFKHRKTWLLKYDPDHLGKRGFKSKSSKSKKKAINLRDLNKLLGGKTEIDLGALGYNKLLATGELEKSVSIKVDSYSASAKEKVEKAGGKILK